MTFASHVQMSPFHIPSFLWMQVQTLPTRCWLRLPWPLLRRLGLVSNSHPSTGALLSLLWWDWVLVRLTTALLFMAVGHTHAQSVISADRRGCSASVFGTGSISSSLFSERCSLSGLLGVTTTRSQYKCEYLVYTSEHEKEFLLVIWILV